MVRRRVGVVREESGDGEGVMTVREDYEGVGE